MNIEDLPEEILLAILAYVSFEDLHQNVSLVSTRFLMLTRVPLPLHCLNLNIDGNGMANFNASLLFIHKRTNRLHIHMDCCDHVTCKAHQGNFR